MFPWYVDLALVAGVFTCFYGVWSCSTSSGFPTYRVHPNDLDKAKVPARD